MDFTPQEIDELNEKLEGYSAGDRIKWAYETHGQHLVLSTSFGIQAAVMLHMATRVAPEMPIIFIDTGYLFKETYIFANELTQQLNLNIKKYHPKLSAAEQEALYGKLWEQGIEGLEKYNFIRKVEPMNRAISELGAKAWLAGLRRSQANSRGNLGVLKLQNRVMKIHPIIDWTDRDVYRYITKNDLTYHPLWEQGYVSVGDWHSTSKLEAGMSEEQTRFGGLKRECGLHELSTKSDFQI